jgi:hypothetical protein
MKTMRIFLSLLVLSGLVAPTHLFADDKVDTNQPEKTKTKLAPAKPTVKAEEWKGVDRSSDFDAGALAGLGLLDGSAGFALIGTVAQRISKRGFISEINDEVFVEAQLGPLFMSQGTALVYGAHLRWDFHKNESLSLYALGGFGGMVLGSSLGSRVEFYPRVGLGAFFHLTENVTIRTEFSHELIAAGVMIEI